MNRCILFIVGFWIVCQCLPASAMAAGGDWVVLGGGNSFWTNNLGLPLCKELVELQKQHTFKCVAFTPDGDWVVVLEGNGFYTSNTNLPLCKKMAELQKQNADFKCVAFAPGGGWTLLWNTNGNWTEGAIPDDAFKKMQEVAKQGGELRSISFGPGGAWVVLFGKTGIWCGGIPDDLGKTFDNALKKDLSVRCVSFTTSGDWFCLTNNGWWTSNVGLPVSRQLSELSKEGRSLTWVAVVPEDSSAGPCWLESQPAQRVKAVLTTDISHPDAIVDDWYVYAPQVPNLPDQQAVKTSFIPTGKVVHESSTLGRSVILTQITDGRKQFHGVLTIEAMLMSRHLRALSPGQKGPNVKDLSADDVRNYTRSSQWLDFNSKAFHDWMDVAGLKRTSGESDMAYARRALTYIKHHFTYEWPTAADTASKTCSSGKSDCGGLSDVFASLMRTNGIPARLLGGRWAVSQDKSGSQTHVKAEFFAHGIGWVPVDASSAVTDTSGGDYAFLGNDPGDFIAMADDQDLVLDSFVAGRQNIAIFQGLAYWWHGSGTDKNNSFKDVWTVEKEKM